MYQSHGFLARILGLQSKGRRRKESLKKSKERRLTLESLEQRRLLSASGLIARPLPQVVIPQGTSAQFISLASAFHEADGSRPPLNYTVLNNTNPQLFTVLPVDASSGRLLLQVPPDVSGTAEITVQATDPYGQSADATVEVAVAGDSGISEGDTNLLNGQSLDVGTVAGLSAFSGGTLGIAHRNDYSGSGGSGGSGGGDVWDFWNDGYGSGGGSASGGGGASGGSGGLDTWTDLYSWPSVAAPGAPVDVVAVVTDQNGEPITAGEGVEFAYVGENPFALGWGTTDDSGDAYLTMTSLPAGDDQIQAGYPGDGYYSPSVSYTNEVVITGVAITNLPPNNSLAEGSSVALGGSFRDADGHPATPDSYSWTVSDDNGDNIDTGSAASYTFTPATSGTFTVSVTAILNGVPSTDTRTLVATNVPPVWTSGTIVGATANVGQNYNLPAVTFHDAGSGSFHTATVAWGDGNVTDSEVDEAPTDPNDPTQGLDGTISDSHAYAATGPYTATITLTDDAGASITKTFNVTVVNAEVALTNFTPSPDHSELQVQYTISGTTSAPFNIGIYASSDGSSPDQLLTSYAVGAVHSSELTAVAHTVYIPANYADPQQDYHLIAVSDASTTNNTLEFAGGIFIASDPTQDPPQPYLCVFGTPGNDTIEISTTSITLNGGAAFSIPAGISEIHVHGEDGNDSLTEDAGVTPPVWYYGGDGNDTVSGQKYGDTIDDGDAGPPELRADGPPTITEGQPATLALQAALGNATIVGWYIQWGDGTYEPVFTTSPSHYYTSGTGVYTVSVSALDSDGGYDTCPNTVSIGVLPRAPTGLTAVPSTTSGDAVSLSWTDVSTIATGYKIQQSTDGTNFSTIATVGGGSSSYQVDALESSTHYYFRVCAVNDAGVSAYVSADCTSNSDGDSESGSLPGNDDNSTAATDLGMDLEFYGKWFSQVFVNNNGNLTISAPTGNYRPTPLSTDYGAIIAPFFADVDTVGDAGTVTYGPTTVNGHTAWAAYWNSVDYYNVATTGHDSKTDTFSVKLVDRSDVAPGDFDIIFNYAGLNWDTGDASGGEDGLAKTDGTTAYPARAGYSNGTGDPGTFYELSGSGSPGGLLYLSGSYTYQIRNNQGSDVGLTAYRTGGNYGTAVSEADRASGDPSNYVNLVNDGYTLDPTGSVDDMDYNSDLIAQDLPIAVSDENLARITLQQAPTTPSGGTCQLVLSNPASARIYDSSGYALTDGTSATQTITLPGLLSGNVDVYVEGLHADPDFSLTYQYLDSSGNMVASTSIHMAIADISVVDVNEQSLSFLPVDEDLPVMLDSTSAGDIIYGVYGSLNSDEYKTNVAGLQSDQIDQVTVTSDIGDEYEDSMTDTAQGAQSNLFAVVVDNNGNALTEEQHGHIRSLYNLNAIDPPDGEQVEVKTKKDDQSRKVEDDPTATPFAYPFNQTAEEHLDDKGNPKTMVTSSVACSNGKLAVTIRDGADWSNDHDTSPQGHDILKVFQGDSKQGLGDTDSAQFAVVWTDAQGKVVGTSYTNAQAQGNRSFAATWGTNKYTSKTPKNVGERAVVNDEATVPAGAVSVNVVLLFTDILRGPREATADVNTNGHGDLVAIIGSWTGKLDNGEWKFSKNQDDLDILPQIKNGWPTAAQVWGSFTFSDWAGWNGDVKNRLEQRTNGKFTLSIREPNRKNSNLNANKVPIGTDTGFDIIEKP